MIGSCKLGPDLFDLSIGGGGSGAAGKTSKKKAKASPFSLGRSAAGGKGGRRESMFDRRRRSTAPAPAQAAAASEGEAPAAGAAAAAGGDEADNASVGDNTVESATTPVPAAASQARPSTAQTVGRVLVKGAIVARGAIPKHVTPQIQACTHARIRGDTASHGL